VKRLPDADAPIGLRLIWEPDYEYVPLGRLRVHGNRPSALFWLVAIVAVRVRSPGPLFGNALRRG